MSVFMSAVSSIEKTFRGSVMAVASSGDREETCDEQGPVEWNLPGFTGQVRIGTAFGDLPIEALRVRDEIRTASGAFAPVRWIDKLHIDEDFVHRHPSAQPICIPANAFGIGRPMKDMTVSPCQQVCVDAHVASRFQPAAKLRLMTRAHRLPPEGLTYYRFHCGSPTTVRAEGVWVRV